MIGVTPTNSDAASVSVIDPFFLGGIRYALGPADLMRSDVKSAGTIETENFGYQVEIRLTAAGLQKLNRVAASRSPQSREAVEVEGDVVAVFRLQTRGCHSAVLINTTPISVGDAQYIAALINT